MTAAAFTPELTLGLNITQNPCNRSQNCGESEDFKYLAYTITYSIVFPIGFISNSVALYVFLCLTQKKTANTVFMINLAISDVGFSLTLPFRLVYYFKGALWEFPDWFCRWCVFSFYLNLYTSVLFLTGLSVLRYLAVVHPMRNKSLITTRRAVIGCLVIWIFVALLSTPFLMSGTLKRDNKTRCFEPRNSNSWNRLFILNYVGVLFGFILPFITILGCYGSIIFKLINGPQSKIGNRKRKTKTRRRAVYLIAVVLSTFLLCFLPYHVIRTVHLHAKVVCKPCQVIKYHLQILVISLCMAASNSCFNPLLYYFAGETFRTSFRRASLRGTVSSFAQSSFYQSFRRRSQSGTLQRTRHQSFTFARRSSFCHAIKEKTPHDCMSEQKFTLTQEKH
ncbi:cysteinyl leukotriene receptor 2 [Danio aesculapii]|uniref:cysteinyl leukotriene receptor 2 n=1 Tax=Danio aesculapii TaxID=1142201 RepID=UPI0024C09CFD|nr:cysteinyl leukotriene receptor 2 [Danio aesculapii]